MARNAIESEFWTSKMADQSEMARNAVQTDFQTSKMAAGKKNSVSIWNVQNCDRKWISEIQNDRSIWNGQKCDQKWILDIENGRRQPFCQNLKKKVAYRSEMVEMRSKVQFGHPKLQRQQLCQKFQKKKVVYQCEMDRNEIESDFRTKIKIVVLI